ncbi:MAG: AMP-binding protein [Thermoprotei archaeon]
MVEGTVELASFVPRVAKEAVHKPAMIWPSGTITYAELDERTSRLANALEGEGLAKGEVVAAFMNNSPEMVYVWLATLRAGGVFLPLNSALKGDMLGYQIWNSEAKFLFVDSELVDSLAGIPLKGIRVFVNGGEGLPQGLAGEASHEPATVERDDPAVILYTSGTTGTPKGVVLPHYAFVNRVREIMDIIHVSRDDVFYNVLPLYHTSGQVMTTLPALLNGLTVVEDRRFHTTTFWRLAATSGATVSFLLNRMVNILLNTTQNYTPNKLRIIMSGGVRRETLERFVGVFGVRLLEGFGMTETCGIALYNTLDSNRLGSVGRPLPSVEARLVGGRSDGELELRPKIPHTMFSGYLGEKPIAWAKGEWFKTGDILRIDDEGFYYYVERKKDLIRSRGENIIPSQIERVAEEFPGVVECAAVGVPGELGDEEILLALKVEGEVDTLKLMHHLSEKLPYYMIPRYLLYVDEIPKTPTQKIRREAVRKLGLEGAVDVLKLGFHIARPN